MDALPPEYPASVFHWTGKRREVKSVEELIALRSGYFYAYDGFDHGVGHPLLVLYDAKTPCGQKTNEFNGFLHDASNTSLSLF